MANPVLVTITSSGVDPCDITLYQSNPSATRPNSVQWTNNSGSSVSWNCDIAATYLATQAPPNASSPASPNATIADQASLTLWVRDNAAIGNGVSKTYTLKIGTTVLTCTTADPPDLMIEP
jgi:hypothetical protein